LAITPKTIYLAIAVFLVGAGALMYRNTHPDLGYYSLPTTPTANIQAPITQQLLVQISGEVQNPGMYRVPEGTRVYELIQIAGGANPGADLDKLKLPSLLKDGQKIKVSPKKKSKPKKRTSSQ